MNKLGFGLLRPPMKGEEVDNELLCQMVDTFMAQGGRYFDTAYVYLKGKSEEALRDCLTSRYSRDAFELADKLPINKAENHTQCQEIFDTSLERCGVDYFDVYLLHGLHRKSYALAQERKGFEFLQQLKAAGKIKRMGFSFHDTANLLDQILTEHPEVDCVQLQINYLDWESPGIQSRLCYETALRHGKQVLVMEPVKGGTLAAVPEEAQALLKTIDPAASPASHALRFAQSLPGVEIVLSGMNSMEQMIDNLQQVEPMGPEELDTLQKVADVLNSSIAVACTGCGYCLEHCPQNIPIPQYFQLFNEHERRPDDVWKLLPAYRQLGQSHGLASACIACGACAANCPQQLPIPEHMASIRKAFEETK